MEFELIMTSERETRLLAKQLGENLTAGDVILLEGDLGAGKTTFTKGLGEGLLIPQMIKSPTFTIIREYKKGRLPLYHMDVYRLEDTSADELGLEEYFYGASVSVVEWAQFVREDLPEEYLEIKLFHIDENTRKIVVKPVGQRYEQLAMEVFGK
ncbi:TPA_asm: tRNA (adenosine(37)-N6)-threonylcarbamoyltransferase complex ATPase subunit type 1 TsaE [Listeria monocytogenes]|uniref:tRNA threonylcarbamoyladenosine biosynthesis protein TsaE n=1 Tax=Listeria monocytogenes TaxID=1639 RepID=A0A9P3QT22_LISMN|nr:tRNA (adenosine(37)-N6)-threonylcarbamoyltransferase complex ATPase subunit type 1 TsaE [Listeria monocytogenes]EAC3245011.1 tRNA (adenosine(37)-N6)-threonylcarbamoyltransferase complex ATPase subunit type 1 TsaE [Listeria monocytogenes]EAC3349058.1 tRNA (adenosine(37)-N6)-threonylcarbamoyltransferase complex ATPase subunit type 1 TsaE [Listeria monocytogenes]EAC9821035.1 tRNA (adenosine(37)-N6)-threonylcarbamoyltransferase complex ATPase subunit type 1 TsaE [Listeria monocytogenes]EAD889630